MSTPRPLRVVIDARIRSGDTGGVESVIVGLATGISALTDAADEYVFLTIDGEDDWLRPHLSGQARALATGRQHQLRHRLATTLPPLAAVWRRRPGRRLALDEPPPSDGTIERLDADVMHFAFQSGFVTSVPSIYHPHDLQHLHLPEFFTPEQRARRERWYRPLCAQAAMVAVASTWTKADLQLQYGLSSDKVRVVPLAPPTAAFAVPTPDDVAETLRRLAVPSQFILYPAQTWPHKNHINLIRALALLRDRHGLRVPLVATGQLNEHFPAIQSEVNRLAIGDLISWPGFVSPRDLMALYAGARAIVIPSRFEAASAPLWEAFLAGIPAACSNVTSLPEQAGDAALIFDPDDVDGIARAIEQLWTDGELRQALAERGRARVGSFTWDRTARTFRAHYRRLASTALTEEDVVLLSESAGI